MKAPAPPTPERPHVFLIRFSGELSIKAKGTRHRFTDRLIGNLQDALRSSGIDFELRRTWSRLFVTASSADAVAAIRRVFGVSSTSLIEHRTWESLDDLVDRIKGSVAVKKAVRHGKTSVEICDAAKAMQADIVVIGSHGRTGLSHVLIGSVAETVVRHADCPVLVVRAMDKQAKGA